MADELANRLLSDTVNVSPSPPTPCGCFALAPRVGQFSLDAYVDLFNASIECSRTGESEGVGERCDVINKYHTLSVYEYTCRGLFERHKLLFSLQVFDLTGGSRRRLFPDFRSLRFVLGAGSLPRNVHFTIVLFY